MVTASTDKYLPINESVKSFLAVERGLYIDGQSVPNHNGRTFPTYNPSNGEILAYVAEGDAVDVDRAVLAARQAFDAGPWRHKLTPAERGKLIWRLAELIEAQGDVLSQLDALDNGKPVTTARQVDVVMAADHLRYYAGWPTKLEGSTIPVSVPDMLNYTVREPVGVCGLIVPWNYPLLMAIWKIAPALAAGNCIILKPAEQTPLSALYLAELFDEAGFPPGVFNVITGYGETAGAALVDSPGVNKVGFTGSVEVAQKIIRASAGTLKRVSLELGGKSPNIIFADADIEAAIPGATWAIFGNNGQSCTAGARLYIEEAIFDEVVNGMADEAKKIRVGPGMHINQPDLGPIVSKEQLGRVMGYVEEGRRSGGEVVAGGQRIGGTLESGYFIEPTIFVNVDDEMSIAREEIFGPVVCAMPFREPEEIIRRANHTEFGLAAGLWTRDVKKAHRMAAALQAGTVWVNTWGNTDPASPFGGYKQSGHGREMGRDALDLYTEVKSVWIKL